MVLPFLVPVAVVIKNTIPDHPILVWLMVVAFLLVDGGSSALINYQGLAGQLFSIVFSGLLGIPIVAYTWQVLIIFVVFSVIGVMLTMNSK